MSTTAPSKRQRPANSLPSGKGLLDWLKPYFSSTVGTKVLVAVTGFLLTGFVFTHMLGNLQIFAGPAALNRYAQMLKDLGPLLWIARIGLLAVFLTHLGLAIKLKLRSRAARPVGYACPATVQASFASRSMILSGSVILLFVVFHLAHFTFGVVDSAKIASKENLVKTMLPVGSKEDPNVLKSTDPKGSRREGDFLYINFLDLQDSAPGPNGTSVPRHNVYQMVRYGFHNPVVAVLYILAQLVLMLHLSHGIPSVFQSLGLNTPRTAKLWKCLGWTVAFVIGAGNIAIVLAVWFDIVP